MFKSIRFTATAIFLSVLITANASFVFAMSSTKVANEDYLNRLPEDEVVYFVLPDRFENADTSNDTGGILGTRLEHGFDPTEKGFYNGGDLKGLTAKLDYIKNMGITAIWLGPIYKNKAVQGNPGSESSGYHGYWITDFTDVDPHFGTKADLKEFVDGAHDRGMKVYLDIITNHTADVISLRECHDPEHPDYVAEKNWYGRCDYRAKGDYPYSTRGDADGEAINEGFMGDGPEFQTPENFAKLTDPSFAYTPYIPEGEENVKVPAWLNDMRYYHNRGDSTFEGESNTYGDFVGLDDLMTEDPRVVQGMIDIFKDWVTDFKMDGFRVDTQRHVNSDFWKAFVPALEEHAAKEGIPNFYIFAEAAWHEPGQLAISTKVDDMPSALDFPLKGAIIDVIINKESTNLLADLFAQDVLHKDGVETAGRLTTFIGNHDDGRFAGEVMRRVENISDEELYQRVRLGHSMLFFMRGVPVVYYGAEQGFTGDGRDQASRENMFPSLVDVFNDNKLVASTQTTAEDNFNSEHALYKTFTEMASLRHQHTALRRGKQTTRMSEREGEGIFAISRFDPETDAEYVIVYNTGKNQRVVNLEVEARSANWHAVYGQCQSSATAVASYRVEVPALDYVICKSE